VIVMGLRYLISRNIKFNFFLFLKYLLRGRFKRSQNLLTLKSVSIWVKYWIRSFVHSVISDWGDSSHLFSIRVEICLFKPWAHRRNFILLFIILMVLIIIQQKFGAISNNWMIHSFMVKCFAHIYLWICF
jgi:hypothetical protein